MVEAIPCGLKRTEVGGIEHGVATHFGGQRARALGEFGQRLAGGGKRLEGEIQRLPVVAAEQDVADFQRGEAAAFKICQGVEVAEGLGHFPAID